MRIVLDTNVFISGIFFTGPPSHILEAWRDGKMQVLVSPSILDEYQRIAAELAFQFRDIDLKPFLDLLTLQAEIVLAPTLPQLYAMILQTINSWRRRWQEMPRILSVEISTY